MALPDISKMTAVCKDQMHNEWTAFKKSGQATAMPVCRYAIGGSKDYPCAVLLSVGQGVKEWERCLRNTFDISMEYSRFLPKTEVAVGGDGSVSLYPKRPEVIIDESTSTSSSTPAPPVKGAKAPPTPEAAFITGIEQMSNYMLDHLKRICEYAMGDGNTKVLYLTLASASIMRGVLNSYREAFKQPTSPTFNKTLIRCNELAELMTSHILNYHCDLLKSGYMHEPQSHDWANPKKYFEGERFSQSLNILTFYLQNTRNDLWRYTTPKIGESILASVFTDVLSILVTRYSQVEPSDMRLTLYRADVVAILVLTAAMLPSLTSTPQYLFNVQLHESSVFPIHRRASLLIKVAAVKCAPVEILAKVFSNGIVLAKKKSSERGKDPVHICSTPEWLTFLNPILYPANISTLSDLPDAVYTFHCLHNAASKPYPDWPLIIRGLLGRKYLGATTIMNGLQDAPGHVNRGNPCDGPLCMSHLCAAPIIPHTVYAGIVQVLFQCIPSSKVLTDTMYPKIKSSGLWDSFDRNQIWNMQRPPWHHAIIQLLAQHVAGVVAEVVRSIPTEPPGKPAHPSQQSVRLEHHLSAWTMQMLTGVESIAEMIPLPLIHVANSINSLIPPTVKPAGGHVLTHIVACALYSMVNSRTTVDQFGEDGPISEGQWDMMIAVGERLCSLHEGNYDSHLQQLIKSLQNQLRKCEENEELENLDQYDDEEVIDGLYTGLANEMLSNAQGQHALGVIWEFLKQNMTWINHALGLPPILPPPQESKANISPPKISFTPKPKVYNPLHNYNKIFYTTLHHEHLFEFDADWNQILTNDLWLPTRMVIDMIKRRPEFQDGAVLTDEETAAVEKLKPFLKYEDE